MSINSKTQICKLAVSTLGNYADVNDIETPTQSLETRCLLWYDISRQNALKRAMPNFALARRLVGKKNNTPVNGYAYAYEYPVDCLRLLGIGETYQKENNYNVELGLDGTMEIQTDEDYTGMPIRFIFDIETVNIFSPDFKILLAYEIARNLVLSVTDDLNKLQIIQKLMDDKIMSLTAMMAQENRPVKINNSKARTSRRFDVSRHNVKK